MKRFPNHPSLEALTPRSSEREVDSAMRDAGVFYYPHHYVKDEHFEPALRSIDTLEKAQAFIDELNADCKRYEDEREHATVRFDRCPKAGRARYTLDESTGFYREPDNIWRVFAAARRVCCSCHQQGSFALPLRKA